MSECPACYRGEVFGGICNRCKVAIPARDPRSAPDPRKHWTGFQDQDRVKPLTDVARYKEDHQE